MPRHTPIVIDILPRDRRAILTAARRAGETLVEYILRAVVARISKESL